MSAYKWGLQALFGAIFSLCLGFSAFALPLPAPTRDLNLELGQIRSQSGLPGMSARFISGNQTGFAWQGGVRRLGDQTPVGAQDLWHLGSCTKNMTAVLVARLVDRGAIRWDTKVRDLWPTNRPMNPQYASLTIGQLVAHRGGLRSETDVEKGQIWANLFLPTTNQLQGRDLLTAALLTEDPIFSPGSQVDYSNAGYIVVGRLLEIRTGHTWEELIKTEVFDPLDMKSCGFGPQAKKNTLPPDQPWSHRFINNRLYPANPLRVGEADNPPAVGPAGTVHCSMDDWSKFQIEMLNSLRGQPKLLSQPSIAWLFSIDPETTLTRGGWGFENVPAAGGLTYWMSGSNTMNYAMSLLMPARRQIYLIATNAAHPAGVSGLQFSLRRMIEVYGKTVPPSVVSKPQGK